MTAIAHPAVRHLKILDAIANAIRELEHIPSGHLYAQLMGRMDLSTYNSVIARLQTMGLIDISGSHLITYIGKPKPYHITRDGDQAWTIDSIKAHTIEDALAICEACDGLRLSTWDMPTASECKEGLLAMSIGSTMGVTPPRDDEDGVEGANSNNEN